MAGEDIDQGHGDRLGQAQLRPGKGVVPLPREGRAPGHRPVDQGPGVVQGVVEHHDRLPGQQLAHADPGPRVEHVPARAQAARGAAQWRAMKASWVGMARTQLAITWPTESTWRRTSASGSASTRAW